MVCWDWFIYWWYSYSYFIVIADQQNVDSFSEETCSSSTVGITFTCIEHQSVSSLSTFSFPQTLPAWFLSCLTLGSSSSVIFCLTCLKFLAVSCASTGFLWILVTVNKRMSCATRIESKNLANNFYGNIFQPVQWNESDLGHLFPWVCIAAPVESGLRGTSGVGL